MSSYSSIGGRSVSRNVAWNLVGELAPLVVGLLAVPILIRTLGTDRFGILTISWTVLGYFGVFDVGLGRAVTKLVTDRLATNDVEEIPGLFWTALSIMLMAGCVAGVGLWLISPWLIGSALKIAPALHAEALAAFHIVALSIPIIVTSAGLRGMLAAYQRFDLLNAVRIPTGVLFYAAPLPVLWFSHRLEPAVVAMVATRALAWLLYVWMCFRVCATVREGFRPRSEFVAPLLSFGGWVTVANVIEPILVQSDRFVIAALLSMTAVAYYTAPYSAVFRLLIIPSAFTVVLFPALAEALVVDRARAVVLLDRGARCISLALFPLILLGVLFAREGLTLWLGSEFAQHSAAVFQWLLIGAFANAVGWVPYAFIQAADRPDLTAKVHLIEAPVHLLVLWCMIAAWGVKGAAISLTITLSVDAVVALVICGRLLPEAGAAVRRAIWLLAPLSGAASLGILLSDESLGLKTGFFLATSIAFLLTSWTSVISGDERMMVKDFWRLSWQKFASSTGA